MEFGRTPVASLTSGYRKDVVMEVEEVDSKYLRLMFGFQHHPVW